MDVARTEGRDGDRAAVDERRHGRDPNEAAPGTLANQLAEPALPEVVRQPVAAGAGELVDDHDLRAPDGGARSRVALVVAAVEVAEREATEHVDDVCLTHQT